MMVFTSKYAGTCWECRQPYAKGDMIDWEPSTKHTRHLECSDKCDMSAEQMAETFRHETLYWCTRESPAYRRGTIIETSKEEQAMGYPKTVMVVDHGKGELNDGTELEWCDAIKMEE